MYLFSSISFMEHQFESFPVIFYLQLIPASVVLETIQNKYVVHNIYAHHCIMEHKHRMFLLTSDSIYSSCFQHLAWLLYRTWNHPTHNQKGYFSISQSVGGTSPSDRITCWEWANGFDSRPMVLKEWWGLPPIKENRPEHYETWKYH